MECCICLENIDDTDCKKLDNCEHVFHKDCINEWFKNNVTCPICRNVNTNIYNTYLIKYNWFPFIKKECILTFNDQNIQISSDKLLLLNFNKIKRVLMTRQRIIFHYNISNEGENIKSYSLLIKNNVSQIFDKIVNLLNII